MAQDKHGVALHKWFASNSTLTCDETARLLNLKPTTAAVYLARMAAKGRLVRVSRGVYSAPTEAAKPATVTGSAEESLRAEYSRVQADLARAQAEIAVLTSRASRLEAALAALDG